MTDLEQLAKHSAVVEAREAIYHLSSCHSGILPHLRAADIDRIIAAAVAKVCGPFIDAVYLSREYYNVHCGCDQCLTMRCKMDAVIAALSKQPESEEPSCKPAG